MKTTSLWVVLAALACGLAQAEPYTLMAGSGGNRESSIHFETRLEPWGKRSQGMGGGIKVSREVFHRYMQDFSQKKYFGYDIKVEALDEQNAYLVTILPLSVGPHDLRFEKPDSWSALSLPRYAEPQRVGKGDTIVFDLLINPATGQKVVEYLTIGVDPMRRITALGPARDFTVEDVQISMMRPRVAVNGEPLEDARTWSVSPGRVGWISLQPQGRFLFSLLPFAELGFRRAGEIRGSTLTFDWGTDSYEINCQGSIAPGQHGYHLYVFHDPAYRPRGPEAAAEFLIGSAHHAEHLLP